jgi:DNA-directed RNA polymerase alpha subunit
MFFYPKKGEGIMIFDDVKLAQPAQRALHNAGFTHLNQLTKITKNELAKLQGIGPKALEQLDKVLTKKRLTFAKEK